MRARKDDCREGIKLIKRTKLAQLGAYGKTVTEKLTRWKPGRRR